MNDTISRTDAIKHLKKRLYETALNSNTEHPYYEEIADNRIDVWMNEVPATASEIIRCKECKFAHMTTGGECKYCDIWFPDESEYLDGDYFCASAERRTDEAD